MEYIYGRKGALTEYLKTVGDKPTDLAGRLETKVEYADCVITDTCTVGEHYKSEKDASGTYYDWYLITEHLKSIDFSKKFEPRVNDAEDAIAGILEVLPELTGGTNV